MTFERMMESIVEETLNEPTASVEFFNGTMFVNRISYEQALKVLNEITSIYNEEFDSVVTMSRIGDTDEYAYDFQ